MEERGYWIAWSGCPGIGPVRFGQLIKAFESAKGAWEADKGSLEGIGYRGEGLGKIMKYRESYDFEKEKREMEKWGIVAVTQVDDGYPVALKEIEQAPIVVYVISNMKNKILNTHIKYQKEDTYDLDSTGYGMIPQILKPASQRGEQVQDDRERETKNQKLETIPLLAVVGTRKVTFYGRQVTEMLVKGLVDAGVGIISGLMYGVDEVAHRVCVEAGGYTIGVWAGGLDTLFKGSRKVLAELILNHKGVLVSEYPVGSPPSAQTFPYRNRIVAGLSCGVLVTEGTERSGTLITAGYAAEQGKEVFAVPGPITSQQSEAPSKLIKSGAKVVTRVEDILDELKIKNQKLKIGEGNSGVSTSQELRPASRSLDFTRVTTGKQNSEDLTKEEQQIWELLRNEALSLDELARSLKKSAGEIGSVLSLMELRGLIKRLGDRWSVAMG